MTETTPLDLAHAAMEAAPEDTGARLRFYALLADTELILLLDDEAGDDRLSPVVFTLEDGRFVMAFDSDDRFAAFTEAPSPYAAVPGRVIAAQLAGRGLGLGLNLGVAPSAFLMPAEATAWLAGTLAAAQPERGRATGLRPVAPLSGGRFPIHLSDKLARLAGQARQALVAGDGAGGHLVAFVGARPGSEDGLARAVAEALAFSGEAAALDVIFLDADDAALPGLAAVAQVLDLPQSPQPEPRSLPAAPGMDPDRPPKLR